MSETVKYLLDEERMPTHWYNIVADFPAPPEPPVHPATHKPLDPTDLEAIFPKELIRQEISAEREIEIPAPVRKIYRQWRPSPLFRPGGLKSS